MKIKKALGLALWIALLSILPWPSGQSLLADQRPISEYQACFKNCMPDSTGYSLIRNFEGYSPFVYKDSAGVPTIGFGHAIKRGEHITEPLIGNGAEQLLEKDVSMVAKDVNRLVNAGLTSSQFNALTSFAYNVGTGTLKRSTLLKKVNAHRDREVPAQFMRYVYAGDRKLAGLVLRRRMEAELYSEIPH